jgi:hypothetical protein
MPTCSSLSTVLLKHFFGDSMTPPNTKKNGMSRNLTVKERKEEKRKKAPRMIFEQCSFSSR